jgi:methylated-DNA-[protein]-cysteine S-methyltransferase
MNLRFSVVKSPLGGIFVAVTEQEQLAQLHFLGHRKVEDFLKRLDESGHNLERRESAASEINDQIRAYFARKLRRFEVAVYLEGTDFQRRVWNQLPRIPYGETITYGELAARLGIPKAARAIGRANATNPVALVLPCHRVVGHSGLLTGYGAGIAIKKALLELEGVKYLTPRGSEVQICRVQQPTTQLNSR